jgi:hypothetical protein
MIPSKITGLAALGSDLPPTARRAPPELLALATALPLLRVPCATCERRTSNEGACGTNGHGDDWGDLSKLMSSYQAASVQCSNVARQLLGRARKLREHCAHDLPWWW